jgi:hypothetical protein
MTSGPEPLGRWSSQCGTSLPFPQLGTRYRVIREFKDHDSEVHAVGEEWTFLGSSFVPYHSGMSFVVSVDDRQECLVPLLWMPEGQGHVLDNLEQYIAPVEDWERLQYHPQLPRPAPVVENRARSEPTHRRTLPLLFALLGPFVLISAYLWLARALGQSNLNADFIAIMVSVVAGAAVLWRMKLPVALWLVLYVPIESVAVFVWAASIDPGL